MRRVKIFEILELYQDISFLLQKKGVAKKKMGEAN